MALRTTLNALAQGPGTVREIAARTSNPETSVAAELTTLHSRGRVTREKVPQEKGRKVYQYRLAAPPAS